MSSYKKRFVDLASFSVKALVGCTGVCYQKKAVLLLIQS
jgi:hypothetical protein